MPPLQPVMLVGRQGTEERMRILADLGRLSSETLQDLQQSVPLDFERAR